MNELNHKKIEFSKTFLGPIMYEFCDKLKIHLDFFDEKDSVVLFVARDGLRIKYLYDIFIENNNYEKKKNLKLLYISRFSVINGCLSDNLEKVYEILDYFFDKITTKEFLKLFLNKSYDRIPKELLDTKITLHILQELFKSNRNYGAELRKHFSEQKVLFERYIKGLTKNKKNIILIDSGWGGSTQAILMNSFNNLNWIGLYFGKWDYWNKNQDYLSKIHGVCIKDNICRWKGYRTNLLYYHHIIEEPLEARIPSVEKYCRIKNQIKPNIDIDLSKIPPQIVNDEFFYGIVEYIKENKNLSSLEIKRRADIAYKVLSKKISYPEKNDIEIMQVNPRISDFKEDYLLYPVKKDKLIKPLREKKNNCRNSLWKQGQIRYEFPIIWPLILFVFNKYTKRSRRLLFN